MQVLLALGWALAAGCARYESPCRITAEEVAWEDVDPSAAVAYAPNGGVVALWFGTRSTTDAGTDSASQVRGTHVVEVVDVDETGRARARHSVTAPAALRGRKGSTESVGAVWTGAGVLFHWVETATVTSADGTVSTTSTARIQYVDASGAEGELHSVVEAGCGGCMVRLSGASSVAGTAILYAALGLGDGLGTSITQKKDVRFLSFSPYGKLSTTGALAWAEGAADSRRIGGASGLGAIDLDAVLPILTNATGAWTLIEHGRAWVVDENLSRRAGPFESTSGALISWDPRLSVGGRAFVSPIPGTSEWAEAISSGADPNLMFAPLVPTAGSSGRAERFSTGTEVSSIAGDARGYGVTFASGAATYFAWLAGSGVKVGGDLDLGERISLGPRAGLADPSARQALLLSSGAGRFVHVMVRGSSLRRQEIVCAR